VPITFANLLSCIALFIALGSGAYAATQLPKNSVGPGQIRKNAVSSAKIRNGSLRLADFKGPQRAKLRGARGPAGESGPQGLQGAPGLPGPPGATDVVTRYGKVAEVTESKTGLSYATCNAGEAVTGGGYTLVSAPTQMQVTQNTPAALLGEGPTAIVGTPGDGEPAEGWLVGIENETAEPLSFLAFAMCASP